MRIIRNERRIGTMTSVGKTVPWVALLVLGGGLAISYVRPQWLLVMVVSVVVGVALSILGGRFAERYAGPMAHHEALPVALKGLDSRHVLVQYLLPAPQVLFDPGGATVVIVKTHAGEITFEEGRFRSQQKGRFFRQLAGQESIGLVHEEAIRLTEKVEGWLADHVEGADIPVRAAIEFVNPDAKVSAPDSPVPAFYGKKIKSWLRGPGKRKPLPSGDYEALVAVLESLGPEAEA